MNEQPSRSLLDSAEPLRGTDCPPLTREEKQARILARLSKSPELSDRAIASELGCDHKTVAAVRKRIAGENETPHGDFQTMNFPEKPPAPKFERDQEPKQWSYDDAAVVFRDQPETRIFVNEGGTITIQQRADWDEDQDPIVTFTRENLQALIAELQLYLPE